MKIILMAFVVATYPTATYKALPLSSYYIMEDCIRAMELEAKSGLTLGCVRGNVPFNPRDTRKEK